ncbi:MAG: VOC family protein [Deltaproteobacteria bacterium]|nr:VOC family protein [Deltaproteobacteria bacterium]
MSPTPRLGRPQKLAALSWITVFAAVVLPVQVGLASEVRWFDLLTKDPEVAKTFYGELFGWSFQSTQNGNWTALNGGEPLASINRIDDSETGVEGAFWLAVAVVKDLEASVEAARRLGGTLHEEITEVPGFGSFAVISDPQGAPLALADPDESIGGPKGEGRWVWAELWTDDVTAATRFYGEVLGFEASTMASPFGDYPVFVHRGEPRTGLVAIEDEQARPGWAPYVGVADVPATVKNCRALGGAVLLEPSDELANGRIALLADPTDGAFFIYELAEDEL